MLTPEELARLIAAEFVRVGASQQSWDQNFAAKYGPSQWIPSPDTGQPVIDPDYVARIIPATAQVLPPDTTVPGIKPDGSNLTCPPGTIKEYINGRWQCSAIGGYVVDPEGEILEPGEPGAPAQIGQSALPAFIGGVLGRVNFAPIQNRQLNGVRYGSLPQVVFSDIAPAGYGQTGFEPEADDVPGGGDDVIQP